ncbi:hypothetical protein UFOVP131_53 [uncultured Caudovirales phage]|uniref:Uncharacterized protein n=1 Tax=uncultured Caudovirales phage TaxID=2100421 RepID=A0A6J5LDY2_9CAUD|nr:hypothetical protein UFOVP131_53 [uncultured Caudovirales phage]
MARLLKKDLQAFFSPIVKEAHRYANDACVHGMRTKLTVPAGVVVTHGSSHPADGSVVEWNGYTLEISMCRRARVVCNVPTPFSLFTFNYCIKFEGRQLAHGTTMPEFLTHAMRAIARHKVS